MVVALKVTVNLRKKKSAFQIRQLLSDIDNDNLDTIFIFEFSHYLEKKSHLVGSVFLVKESKHLSKQINVVSYLTVMTSFFTISVHEVNNLHWK